VKSKIEERKREALHSLEIELLELAQHRKLEASMEAAAETARLRAAVVEEVFAETRTELDRFMQREGELGNEYEAIFSKLVLEAAKSVSFKGTVKVQESDADLAAEVLTPYGENVTIDASASEVGTIIARSDDGLKIIDNSVLSRLVRSRSILTPLVLDALTVEKV
jgi:vacuolar-type H+-ATPase subunit E/Vma4